MNNLFFWATKELSQDAVVSCILNEKKPFSYSFLEELLSNKIMGGEESFIINEIKAVFAQGKNKTNEILDTALAKIDIFVEFTDIKSKKHAVIIEDKVNTFLHDEQLRKYIEKVMKVKKDYSFIHFVLFKTGPYYFWEKELYRKQSKDCIKKAGDSILMFYEYFATDFSRFINKWEDKMSFSWISDYKEYINFLAQSVLDNKFWAIHYNGTIDGFAKTIIDQKCIKGLDIEYIIDLPIIASGRRPFEFKLYGICGEGAKNKKIEGSEEKQYYLLPVISLDYNNTTECFLNINKYSFVDEKNKEGYVTGTKGKCNKLREKAIAIAYKHGYKKPRTNSSLKICSSDRINVCNEKGEIDFSELKKEFTKIIKLAIELKTEFDRQ